jgi:hypothetical protein
VLQEIYDENIDGTKIYGLKIYVLNIDGVKVYVVNIYGLNILRIIISKKFGLYFTDTC